MLGLRGFITCRRRQVCDHYLIEAKHNGNHLASNDLSACKV